MMLNIGDLDANPLWYTAASILITALICCVLFFIVTEIIDIYKERAKNPETLKWLEGLLYSLIILITALFGLTVLDDAVNEPQRVNTIKSWLHDEYDVNSTEEQARQILNYENVSFPTKDGTYKIQYENKVAALKFVPQE